MANVRQPVELVEAKGQKHLTRAETADRKAREVKAAVAKTAKPPKWLPEALKKDFRAIGKQLIALGVYSELDADTLGRYLIAQSAYLETTRQAASALSERDAEIAEAWSRLQERYFKQARNCANDLGLTITSRCRLILPEGLQPKNEGNPVLELLKRKEARAVGG